MGYSDYHYTNLFTSCVFFEISEISANVGREKLMGSQRSGEDFGSPSLHHHPVNLCDSNKFSLHRYTTVVGIEVRSIQFELRNLR